MKVDFEIFKNEAGVVTTEIAFPLPDGIFWVPYRIIKALPEKIEFMKELAAAKNQYSNRTPRYGHTGDSKPEEPLQSHYMGQKVEKE